MRRFRGLGIWVLTLFLVLGIAVQPAEAARRSRRAAKLARRALSAYRAGDLLRAGDLFLRAFKLSKRAVQLRNAAKSFEEGGDLERALDLWGRYQNHPKINQDERREASAHVALIKEREQKLLIAQQVEEARRAAELAQSNAEAARRAAEAAQKPPAGPSGAQETEVVTTVNTEPPSEIGPYAFFGVGGVAAITSLILWVVAQNKLTSVDERLDMRDGGNRIVGITPQELSDEVRGINRMRIASGLMLGVGGAAIATGTIWTVLNLRKTRPEPELSLWVGDGAGLVMQGRF